MGRKTYEVMRAQGGDGSVPGKEVIVFSRTLPPTSRKGLRIVNDDRREVVAALKARPGRDIWLFGGGSLFRSLLDAWLVDTVEVAVIPVLLGAGAPLLPPGASTRLVLTDLKRLPASGVVVLAYSVPGGVGPAPRIRYIRPPKTRARNTEPSPGRSASKKKQPGRRFHAWTKNPCSPSSGRRNRRPPGTCWRGSRKDRTTGPIPSLGRRARLRGRFSAEKG